jgi:hypothetical protein
MFTRTHVRDTAPCGHRVEVPNEAYVEAVTLDPCVAPTGVGFGQVGTCGARWLLRVVDVNGTPRAFFAEQRRTAPETTRRGRTLWSQGTVEEIDVRATRAALVAEERRS